MKRKVKKKKNPACTKYGCPLYFNFIRKKCGLKIIHFIFISWLYPHLNFFLSAHTRKVFCVLETNSRQDSSCHWSALPSSMFLLCCVREEFRWYSIYCWCNQPNPLYWRFPQVSFFFLSHFMLGFLISQTVSFIDFWPKAYSVWDNPFH